MTDRIITKEIGEKFLDEHVCMFVEKDGGFTSWMKRVFKDEDPKTVIVIAEIK